MLCRVDLNALGWFQECLIVRASSLLDPIFMAEGIQQTHPLYASDRDILDSLLGFEGAPGPDQLTSAARLVTRYGEFPGADDIKTDLEKVVAGWGLTRDTLNTQCREIWESGWRPGQSLSDEVGSGSDVSDSEAP